jgi:SRSO17 transposase
VVYRSKNELALELIDQLQRWKVPEAPVVADSAYGNDFTFREALRQHDLSYVLAVEPTTKAWTSDPNPVAPPEARPHGSPPQHTASESLPKAKTLLEIARELPASAWKMITWREGTKGPMRSRFALVAVWASHGANRSIHFERVREWLLIEWPKEEDAPTKYWLGYFGEGEKPALKQMVKLAHIRWRVELDYREMKDELGLDHFEGRHWLGFHHHVTLVSIAYAFLRSEQLRSKKSRHADSAHDPPQASGSAHPPDGPMPLVPDQIRQLFVTT